MAEPVQAPPRRYREPGTVETIKCPRCGAPITRKTYGTAENVACPACGSLLSADESGALALVQAAARARQPTTLPLHARGALDGVTWEIIGICKRSCRVQGVTYPWEEFYLYNPYRGFRWLIHSLTDHHWSLGGALDAAPQVRRDGSLHHHGRRLRHFQSASAVVDYVEGEFTWEVHVGDRADVRDFVDPPLGVSLELSHGPDGQELNRTIQRYLPADEVRRAFGLPTALSRPQGVGMLQPNPWRLGRRTLAAWGLALALGTTAWVAQAAAAPTVEIARGEGVTEPLTLPLTVTGDRPTLLTLVVEVPALSNSWRYFEGMLVDAATEEAVGFDVEVSYYFGTDSDGSWSEGSQRATVVLGDIAPGAYILQLNPAQSDPGAEHLPYRLVAAQGGVLHRYGALLLLLAALALLAPLLLALAFERRRWQNSDHPPE